MGAVTDAVAERIVDLIMACSEMTVEQLQAVLDSDPEMAEAMLQIVENW